MNALQVLNYNQSEIRMIMQDGGPWWVLADVCRVLELKQPHRVATRLDDDERTFLTVVDSAGKHQEMIAVNEPGLYSVILRSSKPEAKAFKRWITHEVLPTIRRTGAYAQQDAATQALERVAGCMEAMMEQFAALSHRVDMLEKRPDTSSSFLPPVAPRLTEIPTAANGFMNSMEVAHILGREHNNVLKSIRAVVGRAHSEGYPVDEHFILCHWVHWNKLRCPYYRMDETAISMFSQNLKNWMLAEKLRAAYKEKNK